MATLTGIFQQKIFFFGMIRIKWQNNKKKLPNIKSLRPEILNHELSVLIKVFPKISYLPSKKGSSKTKKIDFVKKQWVTTSYRVLGKLSIMFLVWQEGCPWGSEIFKMNSAQKMLYIVLIIFNSPIQHPFNW